MATLKAWPPPRSVPGDRQAFDGHGQDHPDQPRHRIQGRQALRVVEVDQLDPLLALPARQRVAGQLARRGLHALVGAVDHQLQRRTIRRQAPAALQARLEIGRDHQGGADLALAQQGVHLLRCAQPVTQVEHLAGADLRDHFARANRVGLIEHGGVDAAHVHVDRVAEQHQLQQRNADDHGEGQAVAAQLAQLLDDDRIEAAQVHGRACTGWRVTLTKTSSRLASVALICASMPAACRRCRIGPRESAVATRTRNSAPICAIASTSAQPCRTRWAWRGWAHSISSGWPGRASSSSRGLPSATRRPESRMPRRVQRSASSM